MCCCLVVKEVKASGAEGSGFEPGPRPWGNVLRKNNLLYYLMVDLVSVIVTRCGLRKGNFLSLSTSGNIC